VPRANR
jgi:putative transposase